MEGKTTLVIKADRFSAQQDMWSTHSVNHKISTVPLHESFSKVLQNHSRESVSLLHATRDLLKLTVYVIFFLIMLKVCFRNYKLKFSAVRWL